MKENLYLLFSLLIIPSFTLAQDEAALLIPCNNKEITIDADLSDWENYLSYKFHDQKEIDSLFIIEVAIPFAAIGLRSHTGMKMKLVLKIMYEYNTYIKQKSLWRKG